MFVAGARSRVGAVLSTRIFDPLHGDTEAITQKVIFMSHKKTKIKCMTSNVVSIRNRPSGTENKSNKPKEMELSKAPLNHEAYVNNLS